MPATHTPYRRTTRPPTAIRKKTDFPAAKEPRPPSLKRGFLWLLLGNLGYAAFQWGQFVCLVWIGTQEMIGQFALALAIATPLMIFSQMALSTVLATDVTGNYRLGDYLALRLASTMFAVFLICAVGIVCHWNLALLIFAIGLAKGVDSISDIFCGFQRQKERMDRVACSLLSKGLSGAVGMITGVWFTGNITWGAVGLLIGWALPLLIYDIPAARRTITQNAKHSSRNEAIWPIWQRGPVLHLAWMALPLGIAQFLAQLNLAIPRYFIEHFMDFSALGVFAAIFFLRDPGTRLIGALGQTVIPRLSTYFATGQAGKFLRLLLKILVLSITLGVVFVATSSIAGASLLRLVYGDAYVSYADVLVLVMLAAAIEFIGSLLGVALTAMNELRVHQDIFAVSVVAMVVTGLLLIPSGQLHGAAWCIVLASTIRLSLSLCAITYAWRRFPKKSTV